MTLLFGIGREYASSLERGRIRSWEDLLGADSERVVALLRKRSCFVSVAEVERWKYHAESWRKKTPIFFGANPCVPEPFIALDLEYSLGGPIWLIGACVVDGENSKYQALWSDDGVEETAAIRRLGKLIDAYPSLPIVTWAGNGADLPRLSGAAHSLRLDGFRRALHERHVDLFAYVRRSLRLPLAGLSLKDVSAYFGIPRLSPVRDGLHAEMLYTEYRYTKSSNRKSALRELLTDYNRDDLDGLAGTARRIRELSLRG